MRVEIFLFIVLIAAWTCSGADVCFENGGCEDGYLVAYSNPVDANNCLFDCYNNTAGMCNWWTYYTGHGCFQFANCTQYGATNCPNCLTGQRSCDPRYSCDLDGECQGKNIGSGLQSPNSQDCLQKCKDTEDCTWFTYEINTNMCYMFSVCVITPASTAVISSQKECPLDSHLEKMMIVGGVGADAARTGEVVDLDGLFDCSQYPIGNMTTGRADPIGFYYGGLAYVCGGTEIDATGQSTNNPLQTCEIFDGTKWMAGPSMLERRTKHTVSQISENEFWITGGIGGSTGSSLLRSTEIFNAQEKMFRTGPSLAITRVSHCATNIYEDTVVISAGISAGVTNSHEIWEYKNGALTSTGTFTSTSQYNHFCGVVWSNGAEKYVVTAEGYNDGFLHNTWLYNLNNGTLSYGPKHPHTLQQGQSIQYGNDAFIAVGGVDVNGANPTDIYRYNADHTWTKKAGSLTMGRAQPAAFLIPNDFVSCGEP